MRTRPDRGVSQNNEAIVPTGVLQPTSENHAVVGQLREMRGRWLTRDLDIDDAQPEAIIPRANTLQSPRGGHDTTSLSGGRPDLEDIRTQRLKSERVATSHRRAVDEVAQAVRSLNAVSDFELRLERKLIRRQSVDYRSEFDHLERPIFLNLIRLQSAAYNQVRENVLQFLELRTFIFLSLLCQQSQAWPVCVFFGHVSKPPISDTLIK